MPIKARTRKHHGPNTLGRKEKSRAGGRPRKNSANAAAASLEKLAKEWKLPPQPAPVFVPLQLATLEKRPRSGEGWFHELKLDGYRLLSCIGPARGRARPPPVRLLSRNEIELTGRYAAVVEELEELPFQSLTLDGEMTALLPDGRSSFQALQNAAKVQRQGALVYFVFDLLHMNGYDTRLLPLHLRKTLLAQVLASRKSAQVRYCDHFEGDGKLFFSQVSKQELEGMVSKRKDAPYTAGRNDNWIKVKHLLNDEFVIGGMTKMKGQRMVGALLLGAYKGRRLVYSGKVGTGFSDKDRRELFSYLARDESERPPFVDPPRNKEVLWLKPKYVVQIAFTEITRDGQLRHPVFLGLREDKAPPEVLSVS